VRSYGLKNKMNEAESYIIRGANKIHKHLKNYAWKTL